MAEIYFEYLVVDNRDAAYRCSEVEDSYEKLYERIFKRYGIENVKTIMILSAEKEEKSNTEQ